MEAENWQEQKVRGRDEVLRAIEKRATDYSSEVVKDVRFVMHDYEVDMYRLVMTVGSKYGMDQAYELMSDTVAQKRLRWVDQAQNELILEGTDIDKGLALFTKYFKLNDESLKIVEKSENAVIFKRMDYIDAIAYACKVLGLDVIDVNNKVYARATNLMFSKLNIKSQYSVRKYSNGWYEETIESTQ
jgi:hypothetical protein